MAVDISVFNDVHLFSLLDAEELQVLAANVELREFKTGESIYKAGDMGGIAYIVQKGRVEVSIVDEANELVPLEIIESGEVFGISSMLSSTIHLTEAKALEDTSAIQIDRNDLTILFLKKPSAALDILSMVERHLRSSHELIRSRVVKNPNVVIESEETLGEKLADLVAKFGGSWTFVSIFLLILVIYATINVIIPSPWDPYPFILLNLFLSMLAAIQAPIIMMSQNRQDTKDRVRSELDFQVNVKAEMGITELVGKISALESDIKEIKRHYTH